MTNRSSALPFILACLLLAGGLAAAEPVRPNIIWIVSEDNAPYLGFYGEPLARTPVLDALVMRGVRYANASSMIPARASR